MPLSMPCPSCQTNLTYPESMVGRQAKCRKCGTTVTTVAPPAPEPEPLPPAEEPAADWGNLGTAPSPTERYMQGAGPVNEWERSTPRGPERQDEEAITWRLVARGNWLAYWGLSAIFLVVALTAIIQIRCMAGENYSTGFVTARNRWITLEQWTFYLSRSWTDIQFANVARYGGTIFVLGSALILGMGLANCWQVPLPGMPRWLVAAAGAGLAMSVGLATLMPVVVWLFSSMLFDAEGNERGTMLIKFMLGLSYLAGLVGMAAYMLFLHRVASHFQRPLLGIQALVFAGVVSASQLFIFFCDWLGGVFARSGAKDQFQQLDRLEASTLFWFTIWLLSCVAFLIWAAVIVKLVNGAIHRGLRAGNGYA